MNGDLLNQAWNLFEMSRYEDAMGYAIRARAAGADLAGSLQCISVCLTNLKRFDEAIEAAKEALQADPNHPFSHHALGFAHHKRAYELRMKPSFWGMDESLYVASRDQAEKSYRQAIGLAPHDAYYHEMLGFALFEKTEYQGAERSLRQALERDPHRVESLTLLSDICRTLQRYEESHQHAMQALAINANRAGSHAALGWSRLVHGDAKSSLGLFQESLRLDPGDTYARQGMIEALKMQYGFVRLPYRLLSQLGRLADSPRWKKISLAVWSVTPVLLVLLGLYELVTAEWFLVLAILDLFVGYGIYTMSAWMPNFIRHLLKACNIVLIPHPVGRHALSIGQRTIAVAYTLYPLLFVVASVLFVIGNKVEGAASFKGLGDWSLAAIFLVCPLALWAGTLTTRWTWVGGLGFVAAVTLFLLTMLGVWPFELLQTGLAPKVLLFLSILGCLQMANLK